MILLGPHSSLKIMKFKTDSSKATSTGASISTLTQILNHMGLVSCSIPRTKSCSAEHSKMVKKVGFRGRYNLILSRRGSLLNSHAIMAFFMALALLKEPLVELKWAIIIMMSLTENGSTNTSPAKSKARSTTKAK